MSKACCSLYNFKKGNAWLASFKQDKNDTEYDVKIKDNARKMSEETRNTNQHADNQCY